MIKNSLISIGLCLIILFGFLNFNASAALAPCVIINDGEQICYFLKYCKIDIPEGWRHIENEETDKLKFIDYNDTKTANQICNNLGYQLSKKNPWGIQVYYNSFIIYGGL